MKKTISINISGIIFHIEEDGYEKLKSYLSGIQRYFASYEDGGEITADIENRIAEIFSRKLSAGKQVITTEDVDSLIVTMGNIPDFAAVAEDDFATTTMKNDSENNYNYAGGGASATAAGPKRLQRDLSRKTLGGVCAGIAAHFEVDPVWIRLLFLGTLLDLFFLPGWFSGAALVIYIVLWIILPATAVPDSAKNFKKLYRSTENRTIGGVCGGLSAYFNTDVTIIRLLFVLAVLLFGTGLLLYVVLWISMPEARTLTEKMEMQGEPVTLTNIEANVKKNIQGDANAPENALTKIVLFPFRAVAAVIEALGRVLGPLATFLVEAARIVAALFVLIMAVSLLFASLVMLGVSFGWNTPDSIVLGDVPVSLFTSVLPGVGWLALFVALAVPAVFLGIVGLSLLTKRIVITQSVGWSLFAAWMVGLVVLAITGPTAAARFRREGTYEVAREFPVKGRGLYLAFNNLDTDRDQRVHLELEGFDGPEPKLEQRTTARGSSREDAQQNAQMIEYNVVQRDTTLVFDSGFEYKPNASFRDQRMRMTLYIPYGKPFRMDPDLDYILDFYRNGYNGSDLRGNTFQFTKNEGLTCLTCADEKPTDNESFYGNGRRLDYRNFRRVNVRGPLKVIIEQSDRHRVSIEGDEDAIDDIEFDQSGDELEIRWRQEFSWKNWNWEQGKNVTVRISMPEAREFRFSGATSFEIRDFENVNSLSVSVSAGARGDAEVEGDNLEVDLSSAGQLTLRGRTNDLKADASSGAQLEAFELETDNADANASSGASVELNVDKKLDAEASSGGNIRYRGDARINSNATSGGSVEKE
ncbi:MAG: DUF2807 domain-containing protein [Cytophagales bacterium]|nr:DUF2807 domain-containing protein [Cytophagales bacterium]